MILVTHAVAGGATALLFKTHPAAAFAAGFVSHFILDAIPHWHYRLSSLVKNSETITHRTFRWNSPLFFFDVLKTGIDCLSGIAIALYASHHAAPAIWPAVTAGAIGGVLPDFLQLLYYLFPNSPLRHLQKFHAEKAHAKTNLDHRPLIGITSQLALLIVSALLLTHWK